MRNTIAWDDLDDVRIIVALRERLDPAGVDVLYRRHSESARRCARVLAGPDNVDDLVSTAFTKVLGMIRAGKGPDRNVGAYLNAAVRSAHFDLVRREIRQRRLIEEELRRQVPDEAEMPGPDVEPADHLVDLRRAFGALPERWQRVLWWSEVEDRSAAWIGERLDLTPNAVGALAFRARRGLRVAHLQQSGQRDPWD
ncbi:RNA polymerase sigma factor (sigma-70 family) [Marmoricola sp. OAE513]|uniref:RNA polymerase sigma factor n=1 Tax=Marmoricola sp. OAE513 TaxID=2817894 RepID=UPI001AEA0FFE